MDGLIRKRASHIYYLDELNTEQIRSLDPHKTEMHIPGGIFYRSNPSKRSLI